MKPRCLVLLVTLNWAMCICLSCSKPNTIAAPAPVDVYVAGSLSNDTTGRATWWKNGIAYSTNLSPGLTLSRAYAMTVSGSDVYLAGVQSKPGMGAVATFWKNGLAIPLTNGNTYARATGIVVSGTDIYVSGYRVSEALGGNSMAICWKNGQPIYLSDSVHSSMVANCITVSGNDVYVAGSLEGYWKNGQAVTVNMNASSFYAISIEGLDVYLAGNAGTPFPGNATVWKNGVATVMDEPAGAETQSSNASAMVLANGKTYVAGGGHTIGGAYAARYWVNGKPVDIFNNNLSVGINGIAVNGTDIYVVGSRFVQSYGANVASYWKNGNPVDVNGAKPSDLTCIYLKK